MSTLAFLLLSGSKLRTILVARSFGDGPLPDSFPSREELLVGLYALGFRLPPRRRQAGTPYQSRRRDREWR